MGLWFVTAVLSALASVAGFHATLADPRTLLDRFMDARLHRQELLADALLTDRLRDELRTATPTAGGVALFRALTQVSNPCWYRYEVLAFVEPTPDAADAEVRVYQHFWQGDIAGGLPTSWEQAITLQRTPGGWRVAAVSDQQDRRLEPGEPHGPHTSACTAPRAGGWSREAVARAGTAAGSTRA